MPRCRHEHLPTAAVVMGPVLRFTKRPVRVPAALPNEARWALDADCFTECYEEEWAHGHCLGTEDHRDSIGEMIAAIKGLRALFFYSSEFISVDGAMLSEVRNACYSVGLNGECLGPDQDEEYDCVASGNCGECGYCYCVVMLDRIDYWMDQSGCSRGPYIEQVTHDVETEWAKVWGGTTEGEC